MQNFKYQGVNLTFINGSGSAITGGHIVVSGGLHGVVTGNIADGETGVMVLQGVFSLPKATGVTFAQHAPVYWDDTAKKVTSVATGNTFIGFAEIAAVSGATSLDVVLCQDAANASIPQADEVTAISTADGSDAATTQALANATKTTVNAMLTALKDAGLMAS